MMQTEAGGGLANTKLKGRLQMKVIRANGDVEYHDAGGWSEVEDDEKEALSASPSFMDWFRGMRKKEER